MMLTVWFFHFSMAFTGMTPLLLRFPFAAERVGAFCWGSLLITHFIDAPLQITWFILALMLSTLGLTCPWSSVGTHIQMLWASCP